jgi:hypothetical protein
MHWDANQPIPWSFFRTLHLLSWQNSSPHLMEHECSWQCLQKLATGLYTEPVVSSPLRYPMSLRSILILFSHLSLCIPCSLFALGQGFSTSFYQQALWYVRFQVLTAASTSGMYCRVKSLSTDVSEVRAAYIIRDEHYISFSLRQRAQA